MKKDKEEEEEKPKQEKSVFEVARELEAQQQALLREQQERLKEKEAADRAAYEEQLRREKLELVRLKQGVIEESESILEETPEEKPHYTLWQKIGNFFYQNKWWLWLAIFFLFLGGFLLYHQLTQEHPDLIVLVVADNDYLGTVSLGPLEAVLEQYAADANGDGETLVTAYYMPVSKEREQRGGYTGDIAKFNMEMDTAEAVLILADEGANDYLEPEENLCDLEKDFGEYKEVSGKRFLLADTALAHDIGFTEETPMDKDFYLGIRAVTDDTMDTEEEMQEVFDLSYPVLRAVIEEYGTKAN